MAKSFQEPKPTRKEIALAKDDWDLAVFTMTKRIDAHPINAIIALKKYKPIRIPVAIEGVSITNAVGDPNDLTVSVTISGRDFPVIRAYNAGGVMSDHVTALGIRAALHRELDGCDGGRIYKKNGRQRFSRCRKVKCPS